MTNERKKVVGGIVVTYRKKIYISSKMTGIKDFNYPAFYKKAKELEAMGFEVLNPTTIGDKYGTDNHISFYRRKNLEMLLQADILFIFGDVRGSKGVEFEKAVAEELGLSVWWEWKEAKNVSC